MTKFRIYWLNGKTEVIEGVDIADAIKKAGHNAMLEHNFYFYGKGEIQLYNWNSEKREWDIKERVVSKTT